MEPIESDFQLSIKSNPGLPYYDWSKLTAPQPVRCKTTSNHDLITCDYDDVFVISLFQVFSLVFAGLWNRLGLVSRHSIERRPVQCQSLLVQNKSIEHLSSGLNACDIFY